MNSQRTRQDSIEKLAIVRNAETKRKQNTEEERIVHETKNIKKKEDTSRFETRFLLMIISEKSYPINSRSDTQ